VVSLSRGSGELSYGHIGVIAAKAIGFWVVLTGGVILLASRIEKLLKWFNSSGATLALAMALCSLAAATAELFGLAMIIGAYSMGLGLSQTSLFRELEEGLLSIYNFMVPVFFVVMGMLVNLQAMSSALTFGIVISFFAVISKVFGCGLPALGVGFNLIGSWRVGIGMLPRGEVALIVAGVGLSAGIISAEIFGVSIMMTVVTTVIAPIVLVPSFRSGSSGRRHPEPKAQPAAADK